MSKSNKKNRVGMKYDLLSPEERAIVIELKEKGVSCRIIAEKLNKNLKTIQSVSSPSRKREYGPLIDAVSEYSFDQLLESAAVELLNKCKLKKMIQKIVKEALPPCDNHKFIKLIPEQKKNSNKRRIIDQIVDQVIEKVEQYKLDPHSKKIQNYSSSTETSLEEEGSEKNFEKDIFPFDSENPSNYDQESNPCLFSFYSQKSEDELMNQPSYAQSIDVEFEVSSSIYSNSVPSLFAQNLEMTSNDLFDSANGY